MQNCLPFGAWHNHEMKYADKLSDFKLAPQLVAMKQLPLGQLCDVWLFSDVSVSLSIMSVIIAVYMYQYFYLLFSFCHSRGTTSVILYYYYQNPCTNPIYTTAGSGVCQDWIC